MLLFTFVSGLFLLIAYVTHRTIELMEVFKQVDLVNDHNCILFKGATGIEDLVGYSKRTLLGSSNDNLPLFHTEDKGSLKDGSIIVFYLDDYTKNSTITKLQIDGFPKNVSFHPHGIYLYDSKLLYVINHAHERGGERVEVLEFKSSKSGYKLKYLRSIELGHQFDGMMNDLVVVSDKDEFYITSYLPWTKDPIFGPISTSLGSMRHHLELIFGMKRTYVYFCEKNNCQKVNGTESLMNNGITYDLKNRIYVSNLPEKEVRVFEFKNETKAQLTPIKNISVPYAIDNLEYDSSTGLITGGTIGKIATHGDIVKSFKETKSISRSVKDYGGAVSIDTKTDEVRTLTMYESKLYGTSSALKFRNRVVHGSWCDDGVLVCELKK